jgi:hypothetical protein
MTTDTIDGCTVGFLPIPGGMLFFKNRDLACAHLARRVTAFESTSFSHALKGVNLHTGALEGVSIGVNLHRVCVANTHIFSTPDVTYDLLCERLLYEAQDRGDLPRIVEEYLAEHRVQGGRILVASPGWAFLVEVLGDQHALQPVEGPFAMTNTFSLLPPVPGRTQVRAQSSVTRLQVAAAHLATLSTLGELKGLLRSHLPERGELSICNHRQDGGGTESSHIVHIQGDYAGWWSLAGFPCENDYTCLPLFQR